NKILLAGSQKELEGLIAQQIETEKLREGLIAAGKAVPGLNNQLASIGGPAQAFNPETFLGGAKGIVDINAKIDGQQSIINKKLADMASLYNKVFSEAGKGGGGGKGVETEAQKIQNALNELGKSLEIIQEKNKSGLLPDEDVFKQQEASFKKAIDSIANINIKSDAFKNLVADYKSLAQAEEIQLPFTPVIKVDEVASITLAPLADRMKKVVEDKLSGIKILIDDTASLDSVKSFAEKFKKEIEAISQVADIAGQIGSALSGAIGQNNANEFEGRRQALDAYYEREQELIESSIGSDTIKNRKKEQLDKEVSQKRKQIAREEAQSQKNLNIFEAVINTANAVTRALATGGPILAGIVGALGLAQISAISSAPLPALAGGGLVTGPSVVQVGEYPGAANNPEFISPVDKAQKYIREAVQQAGGSSAQQLFSYIDGDDIVLISERGNYRKQRLG
ncbi:MAG: hypothetical protein IPN67_20260, partial [Bacteroidales bacterium]|nr:hypothetical protein [Bacteroidales bacterium]